MALKKGSWSPQEDKKLTAYIKRYGIWNWSRMPEAAGLQRSGKSSRLRWMNYLKPGIKHGDFKREEEETILRMQKEMGNKPMAKTRVYEVATPVGTLSPVPAILTTFG